MGQLFLCSGDGVPFTISLYSLSSVSGVRGGHVVGGCVEHRCRCGLASDMCISVVWLPTCASVRFSQHVKFVIIGSGLAV